MENQTLGDRVRENVEWFTLQRQKTPKEIRAEIEKLQALLPRPTVDEIKTEIRRLKAMLPPPKNRKVKDPVKAFLDAVNKVEDAMKSKRYGPFFWPEFNDLKKHARSVCIRNGQRVSPTSDQKAELVALVIKMRNSYDANRGLPSKYSWNYGTTKTLVKAINGLIARMIELSSESAVATETNRR